MGPPRGEDAASNRRGLVSALLGAALGLSALVPLAGAADAADIRLKLALTIGRKPVPQMTVGSFLGCLSHDPIPLRMSDIANEIGGTGFLVRTDNDLQQVDLHFTKVGAQANLVRVDRDNGTSLRSPKRLLHFVQHACAQARRTK